MWAVVDEGVCIGCALCTSFAPEIFEINDDGFAEAMQEATDEQKDAVQQAIDACPVVAISWDEDSEAEAEEPAEPEIKEADEKAEATDKKPEVTEPKKCGCKKK